METQVQERDTAIPLFSIRPVQNKVKTEKEERPVFDEHEFVEILVPGMKDRVSRKVRPEDKTRWPEQYRRFKDNESGEYVSGTPLTEWSGITTTQKAACKAINVHSVEALSQLPEMPLQKLGPGHHELQKRAQRFLANETESTVKVKDLEKKLEDALNRISELEKPAITPDVTMPPQQKRRGRPPKTE